MNKAKKSTTARVQPTVRESRRSSQNQSISEASIKNSLRPRLKSPTRGNAKSKKAGSQYDSTGRLRLNKRDICDCFGEECPGCHFPCERCNSPKCGPTCRVNRRYIFEEITFDGKNLVIKNTLN